jgi:para-nitrobenzyl esterase
MPPRLRSALLLAAALLVSASGCRGPESAAVRAPDDATRRRVATGELVGFEALSGSDAWLGIPFARPPVGPLRWRAPRPPEPWSGAREALALGSPCSQFASPFGGFDDVKAGTPTGSEDCLTLNVWAPRFAPGEVPAGDARLPVLFWIHGGGNTVGSAGRLYDGSQLAAVHHVVVVTTNYRLGPFGWFRHPALRGPDTTPEDDSGNYGTLDLIQALRWVRQNIGAFGGDPGRVTIFGESAGGTDVVTLLLSPRAAGLFQGAIVQSGGSHLIPVSEAETPFDDSESAESLRARSSEEILRAYAHDDGPEQGMIDLPRLFRDGTVLPAEEPEERFAAGAYNQVPVILGTNRDENKLFMFFDPELVKTYLWVFKRLRDERRYNLGAEYQSKLWKATGADQLAMRMRRVQGPSVFVYRFDWDEEPTVLGADLSVMLGAAHAFEIPFVFGRWNLGRTGRVLYTDENRPNREWLSRAMMSYWAEFAYAGDPGRGRDGDLPLWSAWDDSSPDAPRFAVLDTPTDGGIRMSSEFVTEERVVAQVAADPRLPTQRDKCEIYGRLAHWSPAFDEDDYLRAGCGEVPLAASSWKD